MFRQVIYRGSGNHTWKRHKFSHGTEDVDSLVYQHGDMAVITRQIVMVRDAVLIY